MDDYLIDYLMLLWWHPESEVVITAEDMPVELKPEAAIYERVPVYLQELWKENRELDA